MNKPRSLKLSSSSNFSYTIKLAVFVTHNQTLNFLERGPDRIKMVILIGYGNFDDCDDFGFLGLF